MTRIRSVTILDDENPSKMRFQTVMEDGLAVLALFTAQTYRSPDGKRWFVTYTRTG